MAQDNYINIRGLSKLIEAIKSKLDGLGSAIGTKVDKVSGKGLSTNDYTTSEKNKLAGIASGAEVNVQSDWSVTNTSSDAYIKNKPTIPSAVTESTVSGWGFTKNTGTYSKPSDGIPKTDLADGVQNSLTKADSALQNHQTIYGLTLKASSGSTITTYTPNRSSTSVTFNKDFVGLGNVTNHAQIKRSEMGVANGVATLDASGLVPSSQLPSYTKSQIENGVFPNMRVGLADDLGDIEETLDEEYTFQPTANPNEIRDGYAQIESLKGNSLVWNQLIQRVSQATSDGVAFSIIDGVVSIKGTAKGTCYFLLYFKTKKNHKYICSPLPSSFTGAVSAFIYNDGYGLSLTTSNRISTASAVNNVYVRVQAGVTVDETFPLQIHDLTQMFGEGYEPTTVEEFERRCPKGMPMDYNEGEVIHFNGDAVKSVGFNQWDEEWELGDFNWNTGLPNSNSTRWRNKNFIKVLGGCQYYLKSPYRLELLTYDVDKNYIATIGWDGGSIKNLNSNVGYINICYASGSTYNNDICINLSDPDKNGTYEPYTEFRRDLPTELFEGGMKSAGTAHDEIYFDKAKGKYIKATRIGKVDLGTLDWNYSTYQGTRFFSSSGFLFPSGLVANAIMARYAHSNQNNVLAMVDKSFIITQMTCYVVDSAYTDAATFKAAMSGVMLYYELAEPIVEEIDIPYMDYQVSNSGTEEIVSDEHTTPIKARVTYNFDTIGTVKQNRFDISTLKTDLKSLLTVHEITSTGAIEYTLTHNLNSTNVLVLGAYSAEDFTTGNAIYMWGGGSYNPSNVVNVQMQFNIVDANSLMLSFRASTSYVPQSGKKIRVLILKLL